MQSISDRYDFGFPSICIRKCGIRSRGGRKKDEKRVFHSLLDFLGLLCSGQFELVESSRRSVGWSLCMYDWFVYGVKKSVSARFYQGKIQGGAHG